MIEYISGDLLVNSIGAQAIAHGCNAQGYMGHGIAKQVKAKFPLAYKDYRNACDSGLLIPGDVHFVAYTQPKIFNLITQFNTGPNAKLYHIEEAMSNMYEIADGHGITTIAMNQIGCGIGGLEWADVEKILHSTFWYGILYVYTKWIPGK